CHGLNPSASIRTSGESFATISNTIAVGLVTGAGLEPAPPACAGALTVKLPCVGSSLAVGDGNLDMSCAVGHLGASSMSCAVGHTALPFDPFRMSCATGRGVLRCGTGFCFFQPDFRGGFSKMTPSHFS